MLFVVVVPLERGEVSGCRRTTIWLRSYGNFSIPWSSMCLVSLELLTSDATLVSVFLTDSLRIVD